MAAPLDLKSFLAATPFFGGLLDASLEKLMGLIVARHFEQGTTIASENDEGHSMYVVQSISVSARRQLHVLLPRQNTNMVSFL